MSTIKLNVYKKENKKEVEKTYSVEGYDLMMGTVEDFIQYVDVDKLDNDVEILKMVMGCLGQIKPLLLDVFDELTEDELKRTKIKEVLACIVDIVKASGQILSDFIENSTK